MRSVFPEYNVAGLGALDNCQRFQIHAGGAEAIAASLKAFFHGAADAYKSGTCGIHDVDQTSHGFTVGHKVIDDEDLVIGRKPLLGYQQSHFFLICIRELASRNGELFFKISFRDEHLQNS